jgi:predicted ATPase
MDGNGLLLLEEPELSLSPAIVRQVPSLFSKVLRSRKMRVRQYIVSTHAWDMLRDEGVAPDEVLVLTPAARGTEIRLARDIEGVTDLAATGLSVGEALGAIAEPDDPARFLEFGA